MKTWFESAACLSHVNCLACRTNERFRASILAAGLVTERDFACPFGITPETAMLLSTATRGKVVMRKKGCGPCQPVITGG